MVIVILKPLAQGIAAAHPQQLYGTLMVDYNGGAG